MKKKIPLLIVFLFLIFSVFVTVYKVKQVNDLKIGDYIEFGKYNDTPIVWRVIHIDQYGNPLIFSDRIISLKAFDSSGTYHKDKNRREWGSNYWKDSNVRQWLNSNEKSGTIKWIQNPPSKKNIFNEYNFSYENEKGFLSDGNFTKEQRSIIKPVSHKSLLDEIEKDKKNGGENVYSPRSKIYEAVSNYDSAYYEFVEDKVFLLSIKELHDYVWENKSVLGQEYYIGKPTKNLAESAIDDRSKRPDNFNYNNPWSSWLRTPINTPSGSSFVLNVQKNGLIGFSFTYFTRDGGIRPALFLDISRTNINSGSGTESSPYIIKKK